MKYILNSCYGGFGINEDAQAKYGIKSCDYWDDSCRKNPGLIAAIERGEDVNSNWSNLRVVNIPDNATDWDMQEYDGLEGIIYVVDGKIHYL